jgi:hypothetical protein
MARNWQDELFRMERARAWAVVWSILVLLLLFVAVWQLGDLVARHP